MLQSLLVECWSIFHTSFYCRGLNIIVTGNHSLVVVSFVNRYQKGCIKVCTHVNSICSHKQCKTVLPQQNNMLILP